MSLQGLVLMSCIFTSSVIFNLTKHLFEMQIDLHQGQTYLAAALVRFVHAPDMLYVTFCCG